RGFAPSRAALQSRRRALASDDAHACHDRVDPPRRFSRGSGSDTEALGRLSVSISAVLLLAYLLYLAFTLVTHSARFAGSYVPDERKGRASAGRAASLLAIATAGIVWMSEIMVSAIHPTAEELGLSDTFVGVFVVAVVGNAAEHATAIT